MRKAVVFAAAFAAGSAMAQVGTMSGGAMGAGGRFGAGAQIPATDTRANGQPTPGVRAPRPSAGASAATDNSLGANAGANGAASASGPTPIVSGTSWGSAPTGAALDAAQAVREPDARRDLLEDKADRQFDKP